jgi:hypothetical protein
VSTPAAGGSNDCVLNGQAVPPNAVVYTMRANGNLDDDGDESTFELAVRTDTNAQLSRAIGFYINQETE